MKAMYLIEYDWERNGRPVRVEVEEVIVFGKPYFVYRGKDGVPHTALSAPVDNMPPKKDDELIGHLLFTTKARALKAVAEVNRRVIRAKIRSAHGRLSYNLRAIRADKALIAKLRKSLNGKRKP